jgi:hypothetical protein
MDKLTLAQGDGGERNPALSLLDGPFAATERAARLALLGGGRPSFFEHHRHPVRGLRLVVAVEAQALGPPARPRLVAEAGLPPFPFPSI